MLAGRDVALEKHRVARRVIRRTEQPDDARRIGNLELGLIEWRLGARVRHRDLEQRVGALVPRGELLRGHEHDMLGLVDREREVEVVREPPRDVTIRLRGDVAIRNQPHAQPRSRDVEPEIGRLLQTQPHVVRDDIGPPIDWRGMAEPRDVREPERPRRRRVQHAAIQVRRVVLEVGCGEHVDDRAPKLGVSGAEKRGPVRSLGDVAIRAHGRPGKHIRDR
jgi:hypothetical protein